VAGYREFQTGEVLTAANVNGFLMNQAVMVFADDAARTTALFGVLAEGMLTYNLDTKALEVYDGTAWGPVVTVKEKRIEAFTGSGTWTVPAGVTYAIAHMLGGGGGGGAQNDDGASGGDSTVAFASGTVSGPGGRGGASTGSATAKLGPVSIANSGAGGLPSRADRRTETSRLRWRSSLGRRGCCRNTCRVYHGDGRRWRVWKHRRTYRDAMAGPATSTSNTTRRSEMPALPEVAAIIDGGVVVNVAALARGGLHGMAGRRCAQHDSVLLVPLPVSVGRSTSRGRFVRLSRVRTVCGPAASGTARNLSLTKS
jgi:hypothetical protein